MKHLNKMGSKTLTSSQGDTHANHSRLLENKELKKIRDISGQKCLDLSKNVGQLGSLEKMLVATLNSVLIQLSRTWKVKATQQGHLIFQLAVSVPSTKDNEYGLFPTPTNMDHIKRKGMRPSRAATGRKTGYLSEMVTMYPTPTNNEHKYRLKGNTQASKCLEALARKGELQQLPTPTAKMYTNSKATYDPAATSLSRRTLEVYARSYPQPKMWHTPTAREHKNSGNITKWDPEYLKTHPSLTHQAIKSEKKIGGALNPEWVEWLMGYPIGWTE